MHGSVYTLERLYTKESLMHRIDARIKLISIFIIVLFANLQSNIYSLIILEIFLVFLMILSKTFFDVVKRTIVVLPFGVFLAAFQPFVRGETIIYNLFGYPVYYEGLMFGITMFLKFLVCVSAIMILSSTTTMYQVISASRKLGMPNIMAMLLGLMIRYLFLMYDVMEKTIKAQKSRGYNRKNLKFKDALKIFGYTVGSLFIRAYEQGERTYLAMVSRGYNENSEISLYDIKITLLDIIYLCLIITFIVVSYYIGSLFNQFF
ncbi:cobalt ECF transporter T component CbiQ [Methanocaldococcus fervens]|uniref:Cobalt ABC transporter, inner membrane subunit CbiQ n=1 Tax=Methanocaldococcus fervens (strain DSM 4213 / JCM 15782 / AG86) TaxID=573064 RepID=C7P729_METFA|nr:cobalt ECF transporter T component CbiQ [Methanocaldococcus fervens]ACV24361.1 cobalt ABC transporter, inner membrane subunit CbiQ [Methanocaldococcus fervens AG86]